MVSFLPRHPYFTLHKYMLLLFSLPLSHGLCGLVDTSFLGPRFSTFSCSLSLLLWAELSLLKDVRPALTLCSGSSTIMASSIGLLPRSLTGLPLWSALDLGFHSKLPKIPFPSSQEWKFICNPSSEGWRLTYPQKLAGQPKWRAPKSIRPYCKE